MKKSEERWGMRTPGHYYLPIMLHDKFSPLPIENQKPTLPKPTRVHRQIIKKNPEIKLKSKKQLIISKLSTLKRKMRENHIPNNFL